MYPHLATLAAVFVALFAAHQVADHWVQTERQSRDKCLLGWRGRLACLSHVATYTFTAAVFLGAVAWRCGFHFPPGRLALALAVSAVTHYVADRRTPLRRLAALAGHRDFYHLGACRNGRDDNPSLGTGAYALDQSYHYLWLFVAALILA